MDKHQVNPAVAAFAAALVGAQATRIGTQNITDSQLETVADIAMRLYSILETR